MPRKQQKPSDVSAEQRTSNELVKLIRKLRWMGMEEEAERVETELAQCDVRRADSVACDVARDGLTLLYAQSVGRTDRHSARRTIQRSVSIASPETTGKSPSTFINATLAPDECGKWLRTRLVLYCVPHHARPLGSRSLSC
jgi:hypothetical protein